MDLENVNGFSLIDLSRQNVILGKNGCGKSYLLRQIEAGKRGDAGGGKTRYISPERGGILQYEPGIDQQLSNNPTWMAGTRGGNQTDNFRQQSATLFRRLELLVLREIERTHTQEGYVPIDFGVTIEKLNKLLDRVKIVRHDAKAFQIVERISGTEASPNAISSGESELISLGIEFLSFIKECEAGRNNILLVDEPDVHLHPDLQDRLASFLIDALDGAPVTLVIATHSTALLAGLGKSDDTKVVFMRSGDKTLRFQPVTDIDRAILPIFGAHPLSNVFNQTPILLVEGEDDYRVWQQAVRSAGGRIRAFPCVVAGVAQFAAFEAEVEKIIAAVYDNAVGYSLRDRDLEPEAIEDFGHIVRMRLACRAAENLMLSDDVLELAGMNWGNVRARISGWVASNPDHQYYADVQAFVDGGFDRKGSDLKAIRYILLGLLSNKPWEVLVGQAIARLAREGGAASPDSLRGYLGEKVGRTLLQLDA